MLKLPGEPLDPKTIVWFSCGAASACAAKLAVDQMRERERALCIVYCDTMATEHPDNQRFFNEVQQWIGRPIVKIHSNRYEDINDVFVKRKFLSARFGAPCTIEMKKRPRFEFQAPLDTHVFGMTVDEHKRVARFEQSNPELKLRWLLIEAGMTKEACLEMVAAAGIELPTMYRLGYKNNNCLGCVKATSPAYWNKVRQDFPDVFTQRVEQSRQLNSKLVLIKGRRAFLDELLPENVEVVDEDLSCGPQCAPEPSVNELGGLEDSE